MIFTCGNKYNFLCEVRARTKLFSTSNGEDDEEITCEAENQILKAKLRAKLVEIQELTKIIQQNQGL